MRATKKSAAKTRTLQYQRKTGLRARLAHNLKIAREAMNMSQLDVGQLFEPNLTRSAVAQWEDLNGGTLPDLDRLAVLAQAFGRSVDDLIFGPSLEGAPPRMRFSPEAARIAKAYERLTPKQQKVVDELIPTMARARRG